MLDDDDGSLRVTDLNDAAVADLRRPPRAAGRTAAARPGPPRRPAPRRPDGLLGSEPVWRGRATVVARPTSRVDLVLSTFGAPGEGPAYSAQLLDVTQELAAIRRVSTAQQLAEATLDTAGCVILVTDPQGVVMRVNAATREITGYDPESLVGTGDLGHPRLAVHPPRPRGADRVAQPLRSPGRAREHDHCPRRPSAAADLEQQRGAVRRRPAGVLRGHRCRRHRRACQHRAGHPPDAGLGDHRADRHRHRAAGSPSSTPVPSTCWAARRPTRRGVRWPSSSTPTRYAGAGARRTGASRATRPPPSSPSSSGSPTAPSHPRSTGPGSPPRARAASCR